MYRLIKRMADIILALVLLIVAMLPMFIVAVGVFILIDHSVIFKQQRYGEYSKKFTIYKFRSMKKGAKQVSNQEIACIQKDIPWFGRLIRALSLDELPQLINVLKGDMSLIGPRPLAKTDWEVITARKALGADLIKPGITGYAQVNGRNLVSTPEKVRLDSYYVHHCCLRLDLRILIKTVLQIFKLSEINGRRENNHA